MQIVKRFSSKIAKWEYTPLCLLVLMVLFLHFTTIMYPTILAFDEPFYVKAARSILDGSGDIRMEHPPLGQAIIALGVLLFGDNQFGWRFFSVIFGVISLVLFYLICRQLKLPRYTSTMATFLLAVDNLTFVQSSVAMLDVYSLTFMLLSFWLYLKGKYSLAGITIGLAVLSKLTGVLTLLCIALHLLLTDRKNAKRILPLVAISAVTFFVLLPFIDILIVHKFVNPITHIQNMTTVILTATFARFTPSPQWISPSRPWQWLYNFNGFYCVWLNTARNQLDDYMMRINPAVWISIIPSAFYLVYLAFKRNKAAIFLLCWFGATYLFWIPASIITDRTSYDYYFYPTVGVICSAISMAATQFLNMRNHNTILLIMSKFIIPVVVAINITCFILMYTKTGILNVTIIWGVILYILYIMVYYFWDRSRLNEPSVESSPAEER